MSIKLWETIDFRNELQAILNKYENSRRHELLYTKVWFKENKFWGITEYKEMYQYMIQIRYDLHPEEFIEYDHNEEDWSHHLIDDIVYLFEKYEYLETKGLIHKTSLYAAEITRITIDSGDIDINANDCLVINLH
jgi:hypothetical protein